MANGDGVGRLSRVWKGMLGFKAASTAPGSEPGAESTHEKLSRTTFPELLKLK